MKPLQKFTSGGTIVPMLLAISLMAASPPEGGLNTHCVAVAEQIEGESDAPQVAGGALVCFESFGAAIHHATSGRVSAAVADSFYIEGRPIPEAVLGRPDASESQLSTQSTLTSTLITVNYEHANYGGSTLSITASNLAGCSQGAGYAVSSLGSLNNELSSLKGYAGCDLHKNYDEQDRQGMSWSHFQLNVAQVDGNDRAESQGIANVCHTFGC